MFQYIVKVKFDKKFYLIILTFFYYVEPKLKLIK